MGKQRTVHGAYTSDDLGSKEKVREMDRERTRPKDISDGRSWADTLDRNSSDSSESNYGLAASIKRKR